MKFLQINNTNDKLVIGCKTRLQKEYKKKNIP